MFKKLMFIGTIALLAGCSSRPVVPTLDGKKREKINTYVYGEPPLIVVSPSEANNPSYVPSVGLQKNSNKYKPVKKTSNNRTKANNETKTLSQVNTKTKTNVQPMVSSTSPKKTVDFVISAPKQSDQSKLKKNINSLSEKGFEISLEESQVPNSLELDDTLKHADNKLSIPVVNNKSYTLKSTEPVKLKALNTNADI